MAKYGVYLNPEGVGYLLDVQADVTNFPVSSVM